MNTSSQDQPSFFLSTPHACSYLDGQIATTLLVDPRINIDQDSYDALVKRGFRRSGKMVYRPHCSNCQACVPVRLPAKAFKPNRAQRRTWKRNQDLEIRPIKPVADNEHFDLYQRYQSLRHSGGSMDDPDPEKFHDFLVRSPSNTVFLDMRLDGELVCVAVADQLKDAISAIYTYFDPQLSHRSLGTYAVLWEIAHAVKQQHDWVYLGYWIEQCKKMSYKSDYRPIQGYVEGRWIPLFDSRD